MDINKLRTMLGFAVRAGKIVYGADNIETCRKPIYLILADAGISERTAAALEKMAKLKGSLLIFTDEKIEDMVYKTNCKAVAILDKNMSDNIIKNYECR